MLLAPLAARGEAHGLFGGAEQGGGLAHAFGLLALRHRVGNDAGAWKDIAVNSGKLELFLAPSDLKKS